MERSQSVALIASPALFLAGWVVLAFMRPGTMADWQLAHVLLFSGAILLLPALMRLRSLARSAARGTDVWTGIALLGLCFMYGQFAIDLAVGEIVTERSELEAAFRPILAEPLMSVAFYTLGPTLLFIGLLVLAVGSVRGRPGEAWAGILVAAGVIALGTSRIAGIPELSVAAFAAMTLGLGAIGVWSLRPLESAS